MTVLDRRAVVRGLLVTGPALALLGCAGDGTTTVHVLAAASLLELAETAGGAVARRDLEVRVEAGPSSTLAQQVVEGRPVDLLLTADEVAMAGAQRSGRLRPPVALATNAPVLVAPRDGVVRSPDDLRSPGVVTSLCDPVVPCGRAAAALLDDLGVGEVADRAARDKDVTAVLGRVRGGEVDAGVVYGTDVRHAGDSVEVVARSATGAGRTTAMIAVAVDAAPGAADVEAWLLGDEGRAVLVELGFGLP